MSDYVSELNGYSNDDSGATNTPLDDFQEEPEEVTYICDISHGDLPLHIPRHGAIMLCGQELHDGWMVKTNNTNGVCPACAKQQERESRALKELSGWLRIYYPRYGLDNVKPSTARGFLDCLKSCSCTYPPYDGYTLRYPSGKEQAHYHTLDISGFRKGYGRGFYAYWRVVCAALERRQGNEQQS